MDDIAVSMALLDTRDRLRYARELIEDADEPDEELCWRVETAWLHLLAVIARHDELRQAVA